MMNQQLGPSVIAAPLAATERRALSQAWYSALHFAHAGAEAARAPSRPPVALASARVPKMPAETAPRRDLESARAQRREAARAAGRGVAASVIERRAPRSPLSLRVERALQKARLRAGGAFVRASGAPVHVSLVQRAGRTLVVALCSPRIRGRVLGALTQARYALARRGIALDVLKEPVSCT